MYPQKQEINARRFLSDFAELSSIGATPEGGVNRPTFSNSHLQARTWFKQKTEEAGLTFQKDAAGNHSAILNCAEPTAPTLLIGSHLDSVYNGGRFDGALGVLAGLEVLRTIQASRLELPFKLEVIDFTDEEGTLVGMLGSQALVGSFSQDRLEHGITSTENILQAFEKGGILPDQIRHAKRDARSILGYIELHIEQGPHLDREAIEIGIVTGIVGLRVLRVIYHGKANHAGTTGMTERKDAGLAASALNLAIRNRVIDQFPGCVATVGQMQFKPGGIYIVPGEARLSIDYRCVNIELLNQLEEAIINLIHQQVAEYGLTVSFEKTLDLQPAMMHTDFQDAIAAAVTRLELNHVRMPSGAGHDAQNMAAICPCGMIFVPSREGISHSPYEYSTDTDCVNGANVLLNSVLNLAYPD